MTDTINAKIITKIITYPYTHTYIQTHSIEDSTYRMTIDFRIHEKRTRVGCGLLVNDLITFILGSPMPFTLGSVSHF